ncbi:MAG: polyprenyl synthetase family protein [Bacteroidota bacterium]
MQSVEFYRDRFIAHLEKRIRVKEPVRLYEPISYILELGGKRLRPVLTLMTTSLFGGNHEKALDAALAIEVFHNFSLIHDDIMDAAPLRRGKTTVHEKWDVNTGILSGDAMLIKAYQFLESYDDSLSRRLFGLFSHTAIQVCEGQQYDMDFETSNRVTIAEYLKMIEYKTAVLVAAAMKMGAIIAGTSLENQNGIYEFGKHLGIAFQLQDDYLDAFGDADTFGKQVGGDIIENKKTFLYLKALELASPGAKKSLQDLYAVQPDDTLSKVKVVTSIFKESGAAKMTKQEIEAYTQKAYRILEHLEMPTAAKEVLAQFGKDLMYRQV